MSEIDAAALLTAFAARCRERDAAIAARFAGSAAVPCAFCATSDRPVEQVRDGVLWWCGAPDGTAWLVCVECFEREEGKR